MLGTSALVLMEQLSTPQPVSVLHNLEIQPEGGVNLGQLSAFVHQSLL